MKFLLTFYCYHNLICDGTDHHLGIKEKSSTIDLLPNVMQEILLLPFYMSAVT